MFVGKVSEIEYERFKSFLDDCDGFKKSEIRIMKLVTICYESIGFLIFVAILTFLTYLSNQFKWISSKFLWHTLDTSQ